MPDLSNRDAFELEIADALEKEFGRFGREIAKEIARLEGETGIINYELWVAHDAKLAAAITPILSKVFMAYVSELMETISFTSVDWGLVDTAAARWARQHSAELITNITDNTRQKIQELIPQYYEQQWTQGQLTEQIMIENGSFSRGRAEMIARTEVTEATSGGVQVTKDELAKQGIEMVPIWHTRNDELVCAICGPRNGLVIEQGNATNGEYPAAHPWCRCYSTLEMR